MFARHDLPNGVSLRPTQPSDRDFERQLHDARRWDLWLADAEPDYVRAVIAQQHHAQTVGYGAQFPDAYYYVIERAGAVCGRLVVDVGARELRVVDIALIPSAQGKGIARTVLQALQQIAKQLDVPLALSVLRMNTPAVAVYAQLGFKQVAEYSDAVRMTMMWFPDPSWYRSLGVEQISPVG
jgi:GNAT superfamily N-acetyltransferase